MQAEQSSNETIPSLDSLVGLRTGYQRTSLVSRNKYQVEWFCQAVVSGLYNGLYLSISGSGKVELTMIFISLEVNLCPDVLLNKTTAICFSLTFNIFKTWFETMFILIILKLDLLKKCKCLFLWQQPLCYSEHSKNGICSNIPSQNFFSPTWEEGDYKRLIYQPL